MLKCLEEESSHISVPGALLGAQGNHGHAHFCPQFVYHSPVGEKKQGNATVEQ